MPQYQRGGKRFGTLKIGRVNCLRQTLLHAGESFRPRISGHVRLNALREQTNRSLHVTMAHFFTPLRWLEPQWENAIKKGPDFTGSFATQTLPANSQWDALGIGFCQVGDSIWKAWPNNYLQIYNWHFRWPQDAVVTTIGGHTDGRYGRAATKLAAPWTRYLTDKISASDYEFVTAASGSREKVNLRSFEVLKQKLRTESEKMYFGHERYTDYLKTIWDGAMASAEVEKIPMLLDVERGYMKGRNLYAVDGDSLGVKAGLMEFDIDHTLPYSFKANEHGIHAVMMVVRLEPIFENHSSPFATTDDKTWIDFTGHPGYIANSPPVVAKQRDFAQTFENSGTLGVLPRGWQWRDGFHQIDRDIGVRNSFLFDGDRPTATSDRYVDSTAYDDGFRSASLAHAYMELSFNYKTNSQIPLPMASVMAGAS